MHPPETKARMKADYCAGKFPSIRELCEHYGVPEDTVWKWRSDDNWQESRRLVMEMRQKENLEALASELSTEDQRAYRLYGGLLGLVGQKLVILNNVMQDADQRELPPGQKGVLINARELQHLCDVVTNAHKGQRLAVGADDKEGGLVTLVMPDIRARLREDVVSGRLPKVTLEAPSTGGNGSNGSNGGGA